MEKKMVASRDSGTMKLPLRVKKVNNPFEVFFINVSRGYVALSRYAVPHLSFQCFANWPIAKMKKPVMEIIGVNGYKQANQPRRNDTRFFVKAFASIFQSYFFSRIKRHHP